jgi:hypothetical protein
LGGKGQDVEITFIVNITRLCSFWGGGGGGGGKSSSVCDYATTKDFEPELLTAPETNLTKISRSGVPGWLVKLLNEIFQVEVQHVGMCNVKSVRHNWTITLADRLVIYNVATRG